MLIWLFNSSFKDINSTQQNHDINIYEGCLVNQTLLILILIKYANQ